MKGYLNKLLLIATLLLSWYLTTMAAEPVQITWLHRVQTAEVEWANEIIALFEKEHPHIKVNLTTTSTGVNYQEKVAVLSAAGTPPDVFTGYADKLGFIIRGFARDITEFVERDRDELQLDAYFPGVLDASIRNGKRYGLPISITTQLLFYNKDMLMTHGLAVLPTDWDETTWTWDRLLEYSQRLTVRTPDGKFSQLAITQANTVSLPDLTWTFGGDWFEPEAYVNGFADRVTLTRPENIAAFKAMVHLYANYAAAGPTKGIPAWPGFPQGRVAMDWVGNWRMGTILEAQGSGTLSFSLAIAPPPLVATRDNTRYTTPLYMSSATKHPEEAWEFIKFAASHESQRLWVEKTRLLPARRTLAQNYIQGLTTVFDMTPNQIQTAIMGSIAHSRLSIEETVFDIPLEINRRTKDWLNPIITGAVPVETGLANLENSLNVYAKELKERMGF